MTTAAEARVAQRKELADAGASPAVIEATDKVYDGLDALNASQKTLLIQTALSEAHRALIAVVASPTGDSSAVGMLLYVNSLIAVAGYANQTSREANGETSTGDSAVTEVIRDLRHLVVAGAKDGLTEKGQSLIETLSDRVQKRVHDNGENFEAVYADEAVKLAAELAESGADPAEYGFAAVPDPAPTAAAEPDTGYGMYL